MSSVMIAIHVKQLQISDTRQKQNKNAKSCFYTQFKVQKVFNFYLE